MEAFKKSNREKLTVLFILPLIKEKSAVAAAIIPLSENTPPGVDQKTYFQFIKNLKNDSFNFEIIFCSLSFPGVERFRKVICKIGSN